MTRGRILTALLSAALLTFWFGGPALAANPGSATTTSGQTLTIQITGPADGARVNLPAGDLKATGTVTIGPLSNSGNVMYAVDVSGSTQLPTGRDCNGDGVVNDGDDVNADGFSGNTLDCEAAGVIALNASLTGAPNAETGLVFFGSTAAIADVDPTPGQQDFTSPLNSDKNGNVDPDIDEVARALRSDGSGALFTPKTVGDGTNFDNALSALASAFATRSGENNIAFFFSDGISAVATGPGSPLAAVIAAGIKVNTYSVGGQSTGCNQTTNSSLRKIADATGGVCTQVTDPSALSTILVRPVTIAQVQVSLNGGTPAAATLSGGAWEFPLSGLQGGWNTITATVTGSDSSTATADIKVYGNRAPNANAGGPYTVNEGTPLKLNGVATDPDGDTVTVAWTPAANLTGANGPTPTLLVDDNTTLTLTMQVSDSYGLTAASTTTVTVVNVAPTATFRAPTTVSEATPFTLELAGPYDPSAADTAAGFRYAFACDGTTFVPAAAPSASCLFDDGTGSRTVKGRIFDKDGGYSEYSATVLIVNAAPTAAFQAPAALTEGSAFTLELAAPSDPSAADTAAGFTRLFDCGAGFTTTATCTAADNPSITVKGRIVDKDGGFSEYTATVPVANVAPTLGLITAPIDPIPAASTITATAPFTDPGILDTHTALWDWGDGTTSAGTVTETQGSGTVTATHTYTLPGIYTVSLKVTDKDGDFASQTFQYIVVYGSGSGFVTGGGAILSGKINFGFNAKFVKGSTIPTGQTEFQYKEANLNFHSTAYEWLLINGARAQYKGSGTVNGAGDYGFSLTMSDGQVDGTKIDRVRMKIWNKATGQVIYDSQPGAKDDAAPTTALSKGNITVHK